MSEENVEVVRQLADAVTRGDPDAFLALCSPDVDWEENTVVFPGLRRRYRGLTELREWFDDAFGELWQEFRIEVEEAVDAPDGRVLAGGRLVGRGRASGVETELRGYWVLWLEDGKVVRRQVFLDRAEALEAAGLSE
jgi:ketosteroid isomerase-like protein